jgi:hypothetical protein
MTMNESPSSPPKLHWWQFPLPARSRICTWIFGIIGLACLSTYAGWRELIGDVRVATVLAVILGVVVGGVIDRLRTGGAGDIILGLFTDAFWIALWCLVFAVLLGALLPVGIGVWESLAPSESDRAREERERTTEASESAEPPSDSEEPSKRAADPRKHQRRGSRP